MKESLTDLFSSTTLKTRKMGIWVLDKSSIPAIMVHPGFITNEKDLAIIKTKQEEIAAKILSGIEKYLAQKEQGYASIPSKAD
jgi:N-acetylmuramoyl-L-alanine amidase